MSSQEIKVLQGKAEKEPLFTLPFYLGFILFHSLHVRINQPSDSEESGAALRALASLLLAVAAAPRQRSQPQQEVTSPVAWGSTT